MIRHGDDVINAMLMQYGTDEAGDASSSFVAFDSDEAVIERARKYVEKMPPAVSGENGSAKTFNVACKLIKGFELSQNDALELMKDYSSRCDPPWSERELLHKLEDAKKASGKSGYLRQSKIENWHRVDNVEHRLPPKQRLSAPAPEPEKKTTTLRQAVQRSIEHAKAGKKNLIDLGIPELNKAIGGGAEFGELILIAARPSHGKSAMALQMISTMTRNGIKCAFLSEEMSELMIGKRVIQHASEVREYDWSVKTQQVSQQMDEYFQLREECIVIENTRKADVAAREIERLAKEEGVKAVVVDYVQLLQSKGSRYETVTENSVLLKQACAASGVLLIELAQMSRGIESRDVFMPKLSDLKESGQLEQDADIVLFLVWPWKIDQTKPKYEYNIFVAKNRNREIVSAYVPCEFNPSRQKITAKNPADDVEDPF